MKRRIRVIFKSGKEMYFSADEVKITHQNGELASITVDGMSKMNGFLYLRLEDVVAICYGKERDSAIK